MFKYASIALATVSCLAAPALAKPVNPLQNPISIADKVTRIMTLAPLKGQSATADTSNEIIVKQTGAQFIKVHFGYFNLPAGAYVTVSDPLGKELYRYDGINNKKATFDSALGENGLTQFSAMSVFGDTAIVRLVMPQGIVWNKQHGIKVDSFTAGNDEQAIADQLQADTFSTCGVNERRDVACWENTHEVQFERTRPVARLLMDGSGLCTGWRVGNNNHMFTNNHCLATQSKLENTEIWFNYQNTTCGGSTKAGTIKVTGKDLFKTDYDLDYSLFSVNNFANISGFGNFGLETRAPLLNEIIYIPQHGAGNPKELSIESDQNGGGLCQIDTASADGRATDSDTAYFCDTIGGSSGSPVLAGSSNKVIALHHFGGCENQGVRIDKIWPQVSSYFGGVAPQGDGGPTTGNTLPVAEFDVTCDRLSCSFDGSGSSDTDGTITNYAWDFGQGTGNGQTAQHTYSSAGSYTVSLTVTDDKGGKHTKSTDIAVVDGATNELQSGVPVTGLAAAKDGELDYFITTTQNNSQVAVNISGGTGDADLYVKKGAAPSKTDYDCRPYESGNSEACNVTVGTPGKVYVKLIGYAEFSGVDVVATTSTATPSEFPKTDLSGSQNDWDRYTYTVPAGVTQVEVSTSGGTGDADLYVRNGAEPSRSDYDCRPYAGGNNESCTVAVVAGEVLHIGLRAYNTYSGVTLDVK